MSSAYNKQFNFRELRVTGDRSNVTDSFSSNIGVRQGDNLRPTCLNCLLMIQFYIPWEGEGGYDENLK
jgi:hypothetical protein